MGESEPESVPESEPESEPAADGGSAATESTMARKAVRSATVVVVGVVVVVGGLAVGLVVGLVVDGVPPFPKSRGLRCLSAVARACGNQAAKKAAAAAAATHGREAEAGHAVTRDTAFPRASAAVPLMTAAFARGAAALRLEPAVADRRDALQVRPGSRGRETQMRQRNQRDDM